MDEILSINLHPTLAAFPGVICILLFCLELFALKYPAVLISRLYLLGALSLFTPLSYFSGKRAHYLLEESQKVLEILTTHQLLAKAFFILLVPLILFGLTSYFQNKKILSALYYLSLLISLILVFKLSNIGGKLVFEHGLGVA